MGRRQLQGDQGDHAQTLGEQGTHQRRQAEPVQLQPRPQHGEQQRRGRVSAKQVTG